MFSGSWKWVRSRMVRSTMFADRETTGCVAKSLQKGAWHVGHAEAAEAGRSSINDRRAEPTGSHEAVLLELLVQGPAGNSQPPRGFALVAPAGLQCAEHGGLLDLLERHMGRIRRFFGRGSPGCDFPEREARAGPAGGFWDRALLVIEPAPVPSPPSVAPLLRAAGVSTC